MPITVFSASQVVFFVFFHVDVAFLIVIKYESALSFFDFFRLVVVSNVLTGAIIIVWQSKAFIMFVESLFYDLRQAWIQNGEVAFFTIVANPSESTGLIEQLCHDSFDEMISAITVLSELQAVVVVVRIEFFTVESFVLLSENRRIIILTDNFLPLFCTYIL